MLDTVRKGDESVLAFEGEVHLYLRTILKSSKEAKFRLAENRTRVSYTLSMNYTTKPPTLQPLHYEDTMSN